MNGSRVINELPLEYAQKAHDVRSNVRKIYNFPFDKYTTFRPLNERNYNFASRTSILYDRLLIDKLDMSY